MALAGGVLIGLASALVLVTQGRIAGISGILGSPWVNAQRNPFW